TVDKSRVAFGGASRSQSKPLHHPRPEVFDHDIRGIDQLLGDGPVSRAFQIERNATLAALEERIGIRVPGWTLRRVDMDHVGALIRKHDGSERSSNVLAEVDHA